MKIALVSHVLPPSWSGQAMMIYRLLEPLTPEDYCLISYQHFAETDSAQEGYTRRLPGKYFPLPPTRRLNRGYRFGLSYVREVANALTGVFMRGRSIAEIVRREGCQTVVACTGDLYDLPAAYVASRLAGVPFYPYIFDYYSRQFLPPEERLIARLLEPRLMRKAAGVIVPNEILRDELRDRYRIEATVIHNPCDLSRYEALPHEALVPDDGEVRIVYTGAIYQAHYDAFRNLIAAIEITGRRDMKLHLYTAQSPDSLARQGVRGPVIFHEHLPASAMPGVQRRADVLFLPLAFDSPYPELVRTSSTSKLAEYLAARRPILVHAPPDSFVSWYFRRHDCGVVVDRNDPAQLAVAIKQILADPDLRQRLSANAWERAVSDFSVERARATFAALLKLESPGVARREASAYADAQG